MKTLREEIIEILTKYDSWFVSSKKENIADAILTLGWYPKEFVEFTIFPDRDITAFYRNFKLLFRDKDDIEYTLDELYNHWKEIQK